MSAGEVAHTIRQQLFAGGAMAVFSWGPYGWMVLPAKRNYDGGLRFFVEGRLYKGEINIWSHKNDTYTIEIGAMSYHDVYCDNLTSVIDYCVETEEE